MPISAPEIEAIVKELKFTTSRSGGPGGQGVNKVNTKVTLRWDVQGSMALDGDHRSVIMAKLSRNINADGELVLTAQTSRSQLQNKEEVISKLAALITRAFAIRKARKPTKPTKASVQRRLTAKKKLSHKKKLRGGVD
jgi:ribosome-associated protein